MRIYTTELPSLPRWKVKVCTHESCGRFIASVTLPTSHGMLTLNRESHSEHVAIHLVSFLAEKLVRHIHDQFEPGGAH